MILESQLSCFQNHILFPQFVASCPPNDSCAGICHLNVRQVIKLFHVKHCGGKKRQNLSIRMRRQVKFAQNSKTSGRQGENYYNYLVNIGEMGGMLAK